MRENLVSPVGATYQALVDPNNAAALGIERPARQFIVINNTDNSVFVSFIAPIGEDDTGITYRNLILVAGAHFVSDIATNKNASLKDDGVALAKGTIVTIRQVSAAAAGTVYFSYWCSAGDR